MSTPSISPSYVENDFVPQVQESGSLAGRVVAKIYSTASYVVCSINHVAQSLLSKGIYIGTFGRYTLEDLKSYLFKEHASLEDRSLSEEEQSIEGPITRESEYIEPEYVSRLKRQGSRISVASSCYKRAVDVGNSSSPYAMCYQGLTQVTKRSGNSSNPPVPLEASLDKQTSDNDCNERLI